MTRRGMLGCLGGILSATALSGCGGHRATLRYRLTLVFDTPSGRRSGGGVVETEMWAAPRWLGSEAGGSNSTFGQAPFVTLDDGRGVFALLHGPDWRQPMGDTVLALLTDGDLRPPLSRDYDVTEWDRGFPEARNTRAAGSVTRRWPMLVSFADNNVPTSVLEVDAKDAAATLGPGYKLAALTFEAVSENEPLTTGIDEVLPWLGTVPERHLGTVPQGTHRAPLYALLHHSSFRVGERI